ncbi:MAG: hypothetical protein GDA56_27075 [Hormoscilla sp. GM7CHS1pb]|nr:hypothetical protein [Hormoscilla sp. GM7CHS1pb]
MAKPLILTYDGKDIPFSLAKVDRSKLYGSVDIETLDEDGKICEMAVLAGDGKTLIGKGGTALAYISQNGEWCDKSNLKPVDFDGNEIKPVQSSFNQPNSLERKVTIDEFLNFNIRSSYMLNCETELDPKLLEELGNGAIYAFPFSYRGGLEPDTAFLLKGTDDTIWMLVGKETEIRFIGYEQTAAVPEAESEIEEDDDMDFGMM